MNKLTIRSVRACAAAAAAGGLEEITVTARRRDESLQVARGSSSTLIAFIRGIGQQDPLWGFEPGVGLHVDEVYVSRLQGAVLRDSLPRNPNGKILKRELRAEYVRA
jgi:acyl-CoA synthetase (AMP-forming)/AMP-acid ligase II